MYAATTRTSCRTVPPDGTQTSRVQAIPLSACATPTQTPFKKSIGVGFCNKGVAPFHNIIGATGSFLRVTCYRQHCDACRSRQEIMLSPLGAAKGAKNYWLEYSTRTHHHTQRNAGFHQKHGHVSRMACITPICAFALHFSMCSFAHSLKASTIASFDTNDFGHAKGTDIVIKSEGSLMSFNASPFVKT
jgi:hypothetical protein